MIIEGKKVSVNTHRISGSDDVYVETAIVAPVYKRFTQALRHLRSLNPPQEPRAPIKPILKKQIFDLIESTILDFWQAISELGTTKGFGNVGVILAGPPGVGKSETMRWLAELLEENYGRSSFQLSMIELSKMLQTGTPINTNKGLVLIDDIDANILRNRKETRNPMTSCFLTCLDGLNKSEGRVIVVSTNEELEDVDPALLRPGRFDHVIHFEYPNLELIKEFCDEREIKLAPTLFEDWSFARIDMFCAKFRVAHHRYGTEMPVFYEKFISEMGETDPTVEACQEVKYDL